MGSIYSKDDGPTPEPYTKIKLNRRMPSEVDKKLARWNITKVTLDPKDLARM